MSKDLFASGGGGGNFPKVADLEGKLVLIKPVRIENVPKPAEFGGGTQDRLTADFVVFEDDGSYEEFEEMYFSQTSFVNAGKRALKPNAKPFVLGRIAKVPSKIGKEQGFDTTEKINKGLDEWLRKGGKGAKPNFAWGLDDFSDDDVAKATKYLNDTSPFAAAESA